MVKRYAELYCNSAEARIKSLAITKLMSRTLDKYGANIRNVNLQQKLNELGIQANISALNQNDKALLRTIILLENTKYAWGDNAQTLNRGANQLRMLKSNFANLSRTIGNIFLPTVAAILPYINGLVIALQRLAERIVKLLGGTDFDWGGIGGADETSLSYLYDDADQLSDNLDDATSSAKKLKNELMGFDEINKLSDNTDDASNTSAGGLDDAGRGLLNSAFDKVLSDYQTAWDKAFDGMNNKANEIADKIEKAFKSKNYKGIGTYISTSIRDALDSINWNSIYKRAENFASGLAEFLNGLFRPDTFYSVGKTITNTLNTAIHSLLTFSDTFDWKNFGDSLAEGINGFFRNFDFKQFAETINSWVHGLADAFMSFISKLDIKEIFKGIWDFLTNLDLETVTIIIGAFALRNIATSTLSPLSGSISRQIARHFALNPILISATVMVGSIMYAKSELDPIFEEYSIDEIKEASREMFADWFGDNAFSKTAADSWVTLATAISKPKEVGKAFKEMGKDIKDCNFELELFDKWVYKGGLDFEKRTELTYGSFEPRNISRDLSNSIKSQSNEMSSAGATLGAMLLKGFSAIKKTVPQSVLDTLGITARNSKTQSSEVGSGIASVMGASFNAIKNMLPEKLRTTIDKMKNDNQNALEPIGNLFANKLNTGFSLINNLLTKSTKDSFDSVESNNISKALSVGQTLKDKLASAFDKIPLVEKVKNALDKSKQDNLQKSQSIGEELKNNLSKGFSLLNFSDKIKNSLTTAYNNNYKTFSDYGVGLGNSLSAGISAGFQNNQGNIFSIIKSFFDGLNIKTAGLSFGAGAGLQLGFETKAYATGGFPEDGLFFANRNELVGQFSNGRTAVANNEQITTGIEEAAYRGMMRALSESQGNQNVTIQVEGDATGMFKVMQRQANDYMIRTGMVPFPT